MLDALKKFRKKYPVLFSVVALVVCWVVGIRLAGELYGLVTSGIALDNRMDEAVGTIFCDSFLALVAFLILLAVGRAPILKKKGMGFVRGLAVAAVPLCIYIVLLLLFIAGAVFSDPATLEKQFGAPPVFNAASVVMVASYLFVGLGEELACRGVVGETLLERFGTSRGGIWKGAIITGILFGLLHMGNFLSLDPMFVFGQIFSAAGGGVLFCAIYYRTGNIWVPVFTHAVNDILASTGIWLFGVDTTTLTSMTGGEFSPIPFAVCIFDVALAVFLLRKGKIGEVAENWQPELPKWREE